MVDPTEIVDIHSPTGAFLGRLPKEQYEAICEGAKQSDAMFYRRARTIASSSARTVSNAMEATPAILLWVGRGDRPHKAPNENQSGSVTLQRDTVKPYRNGMTNQYRSDAYSTAHP